MPKSEATSKSAKAAVPRETVESEAAALKAIFEAARANQTSFGAEFGIGNQSMVAQYLNAKRPLNLGAAIAFSRGLRVKIGDFSPRLAKLVREAIPHTEHMLPETISSEAASVLLFLQQADEIAKARLAGFVEALRQPEPEDAEVERKTPATKRPKHKLPE